MQIGEKMFYLASRLFLIEELGSRTEAEITAECCLLACYISFLSYLSFTAQNRLPRDGTSHGGLDPFT